MRSRITEGADWAELFSKFERSAWRWEAQKIYREPVEQEPLSDFLAGKEPDLSYMDQWLAEVRRATAEGRRFARVRMLTDPLTPYLRFELAVSGRNIDAGEEIRVIPEARARALGLPEYDFWLFDDDLAAVMHFDEGGFTHADLVAVPYQVAPFLEIRDLAWQNAVPFDPDLTT